MSFEAIKSIAEIEQQAEKMRSDAAQKAKDIIAKAKKDAELLRVSIINEADASNKASLEKANAAGEHEAEEGVNSDSEKLASLRAAAAGKVDAAAEFIFERIVNG